jgi:prepilin-type processing-associated H-X9-DG protein
LEGGSVRFSMITDGLSNTLLVGEKHVPQDKFGIIWMDYSTYNGENPVSWGRRADPGVGLSQGLKDPNWKFGSYHTGGCFFAFCDGSVQRIPHSINPDILSMLADRQDGLVIPSY